MKPGWRLYYVGVCFLMLSMVPAAEKVELKIAAVIHDHIFIRKDYERQIKWPLSAINRGRGKVMNLTKLYELKYEHFWIRQYSPPEMLKIMCEIVLNESANTLLYISDNSYNPTRTATAQYMLEIAHFIGLPVIAWIGDSSGLVQPSPESNILHLTPAIDQQCQFMLSVLQRYNWHQFSIVTGAVAGQDRFINVLRNLADRSSEFWFDIEVVIEIESLKDEDVKFGLDKLKAAETRVILFYASQEEAQYILSKARSAGLTGKEFLWIISKAALGSSIKTGEDDSAPDPEKQKEQNKHFTPGMLGISFNTDDESRFSAVKKGVLVWAEGIEAMVNDQRDWVKNMSLVPQLKCDNLRAETKWKIGQTLLEHMKNVSLEEPPTSFEEDGTNPDLELSIYNLNMEYSWNEIGRWDMKTGLKMDDITWPEDEPTPPQGRPSRYHLKVVTLEERPYVVYSDPDPKTGTCPPQSELCRIAPENITLQFANATANSSLYQCCSGFCIDLLRMLSEKIGFDFQLFQVADKKWGAYVAETGQWNGLVRSIMDKEADMVMTSLKITPERNQMIDFSVPFLETGITILVAVRDGVISPTAFLEPFDIMSWLFILMMCIHVVAVTILIFEWLSPQGFDLKNKPPREPYDYPSWCLILVFSVHASGAAIFIFEWLSPSGLDRGNKPIREHRFSLFRSFWLIWAMLFGAAVNVDNPRGVSSRCLANIWALFAVVFTASYTANLAAFMITKEDYDRLSGIQDWRIRNPRSAKPPYKFTTVPSGSTETIMRNSIFGEKDKRTFDYMMSFNKSSVVDGIRAVKEGEINAFIYDATVLEYLAGHDDSCKLRTVGNWYAMTGYGIGFPKGSKWIDRVNKHMVQFQHDGEMERLQKFWLAGACKKNDEEGESSMPLGILNFTSAFILLAGGMLLGGLLLLLEHVYFKFLRAKLRKWDKCGCCGLISLSMGKSLTFEQSVREAIELQRHYKCKNPICETQVWKLKHELDLALLKIDRLQKQLGENGITPDKRGVWRNNRPIKGGGGAPPAIGWKADVIPSATWKEEEPYSHSPHDRQAMPLPEKPMDPGLPAPALEPAPPLPPSVPSYDMAMEYPSQPTLSGATPGHSYMPPQEQCITMPAPPSASDTPSKFAPGETGTPRSRRKTSSKGAKASKSLPTSPSRPPTDGAGLQDVHPDSLQSSVDPTNSYNAGNITHSTSFPDNHNTNSPNKKGDKRLRHHKGNVYVEVEEDDGHVEKETVL